MDTQDASATLPAPPYPDDTKANGYCPTVDWQAIHQARTWVLCPQGHRPWLLMLWLEAWNSVPVGTYPADDDEMIAARIGMDYDEFTRARRHLMRGWVRHSNGLLYHSYITDCVLRMVSRRKNTASRVNRWRNRQGDTKSNADDDSGHGGGGDVTACNALQGVTGAQGDPNGRGGYGVDSAETGAQNPDSDPVTRYADDVTRYNDDVTRRNRSRNRKQEKEEESSSDTSSLSERERGANSENRTARGARLALDDLPDDWRRWAQHERPDLDVGRTWEVFRDYWVAQPGQKGCKLDWRATWRNWVRRERDTHTGGHHATHRETHTERLARINRETLRAGYRAAGVATAADP